MTPGAVRRRDFLRRSLAVAGVGLLAGCGSYPPQVQPAARVPRLGFLVFGYGPALAREAFLQGLRDLGHIEGRNIAIEWRYAEGREERLLDLATELAHLNVDVIVTGGDQQTRAARQATGTTPIVMAVSGDPVGGGLVASLVRPGGNITGLTILSTELSAKRLECCGHLSVFRIGEVDYLSPGGLDPDDLWPSRRVEKSMNVRVGTVLSPDLRLTYEYDFGSTTDLRLRVVSREDEASRREIRLLALNEAPDLRCVHCQKPATSVCTQCLWEGSGWLCASCAEEHECGEEMLLPVVNSPRVGVCAYY